MHFPSGNERCDLVDGVDKTTVCHNLVDDILTDREQVASGIIHVQTQNAPPAYPGELGSGICKSCPVRALFRVALLNS